MQQFTPDKITEQSVTTKKGLVIELGDIVRTRGSHVERRVHGISPKTGMVRCVRTDSGADARSKWMNPEKLSVVARAAACSAQRAQ